MISFQQSLAELVRDGKISMEEGLQFVDDAASFKRSVEGRFSGGDRGAITG